MNTLKDYIGGQVLINFDTIGSKENHTFPGVSICLKKNPDNKAEYKEVDQFIKKYYAEHDLEEPKEYFNQYSKVVNTVNICLLLWFQDELSQSRLELCISS